MRTSKTYKPLSISFKAGVWFTICNLIQRGISFITMPIFTRIMSKNAYGMFSTYISWYSFLMIFTSLNLSNFVFNKGMVKYENDRDNFQTSLLSLGNLSTIIVFFIYIIFKKYINEYTGISTGLMMCMFIHMYFEPAILLWTARQRFEYKLANVIIVTLGIAILNPLFGIIAITIGNNELVDRILANTIIPFAFGFVIYIYTIKKSKHFIKFKYWKYALIFNLPLLPHFLSTTILNQADRIMITNLCGADETALYSVAYSIGMITTLFCTAMQQAILPWLYSRLKKQAYDGIKQVTNITVIIVCLICLLLILSAPEIINIFATETYEDAIWAIPPICGSVFFIYLFNVYANIEYYFEETKYVAFASLLSAILNCVLNYIFINKYGFVAAGYTTLFCYILLACFHYISMRVVCKKHNFNETIIDKRFIWGLSISFIVLVVFLTTTYKVITLRYSVLGIIFLFLFIYRSKIKSAICQIMRK